MKSRTEFDLSENIPCDIKAGLGKTSHSPIVTISPEEKNAGL